jgi:hypothetical protein
LARDGEQAGHEVSIFEETGEAQPALRMTVRWNCSSTGTTTSRALSR